MVSERPASQMNGPLEARKASPALSINIRSHGLHLQRKIEGAEHQFSDMDELLAGEWAVD